MISKRKWSIAVPLLVLLFLLPLLTPAPVHAANKTFTGPGNFSDSTKWSGGTLPKAGDTLLINGTCAFDNNASNLAYGVLDVGNDSAGTLNWPVDGTNTLRVEFTRLKPRSYIDEQCRLDSVNMKVLILGRETATRSVMAGLAEAGVEVTSLPCGVEEMIASPDGFELAIVDSSTSDIEVVCHCIKKVWSIPLILMVGRDINWERADQLDADGYLPITIGKSELRNRLKTILRRFGGIAG